MKEALKIIDRALEGWQPPQVPEDIPQGDMPGDKVWIGPQSILKANAAFRAVLPMLREALEASAHGRAVVSAAGGSGAGKTCVAALLTYYLNRLGVGAYTMSGDNYPRRYPAQNDGERIRIFRLAGVRGMLEKGVYSPENAAVLKELQLKDLDADPAEQGRHPWLAAYQEAGRAALSGYLGTELELEYGQLEAVLGRFKSGEDKIWLKRLGRDDTALWYEEKDFAGVQVLVLEWTHGNSGKFAGVDIPILLSSTPAETRAYRLSRGRDSNADTAFITMVIELEQAKLQARAGSARLIISNGCEVLSYEEYCRQMDRGR